MPDLGVNSETTSAKSILGGHPPIHIPITLLAGQNLAAGHVLGKITASGKYSGYDDDLADGLEVARAILVNDVDASLADENTIAYVHGDFHLAGLSWTDAVNDIAAGVADLFAVGIFVK